jgi:serine/threonine protein kinase/DNA-binding winged helix-turn-helix (wHTH) protein/Tfp pilus assembly protein PilF
MKQASTGRAQIRDFELDFKTGELCSLIEPANKVLLREQPFQVLRMLVEREGKLVGREEIRRKLWPNSTIVDFDHSINVAIGILRKALGDSAASPQYIETLARRGYRLLVPVQWLEPTTEFPERDAPATQPLSQAGVLIGKKISRYRVLEVIGVGGMGLVYKAQDLRLGRAVALKGLPEEMANDQLALQRFEREAQTASALNHLNICTIYGIEEFEGQPFIAMELLEGESLAHRILTSKPNAIPLAELLEIAIQICYGLEAAHEKGIIHRDIKPANIFLTKQGPVKILDFGIAKLAGGDDGTPNDPASPTETPASNLTRTGATAGTAGYMSPEQVRKENLDARTDLFSFGLILYEMAAGQRAFTGATMAIVHDAILNETTRPTHELNAAAPRRLDGVIDKALQKDRERRYQSAVEMRRELERVRRESEPVRRIARSALASATLLVVLVTAAWFYWSYRNRVTLSETDTIVLADISNQTGDPMFDDALNSALRYGLEQTPYLNVLAVDKVLGTLALFKLPPTTKVTPDIARQICLRTNSKMVIVNSIADAGNRFQIELNAINCDSGRAVARVRQGAASRNEVVQVLGESAAQLRSKLGEPAASLARFNKPLEEATSSSLEALQAGMTGYKRHIAGDFRGAISNYQHAIELDPNCALCYEALGTANWSIRERPSAIAALKKAYELSKRMTEPNRLHAEFLYYSTVTGEHEKACLVMSQAVQTFPRDALARTNFSTCLALLGQPDRAADEAREAARLLPSPLTYLELIQRNMRADRLNEAKATFDDADARKFDGSDFRWNRALLAFLQHDDGALQEQWNWAEGKPGAARLLWGKAMVEAYYGRFRSARTLQQQALDLDTKLRMPSWPQYEAFVGNLEKARGATQGLTIAKDRSGQLFLALALSQAGNTDQAQQLVNAIDNEYPLDTVIQYFHLPTIRASIKLRENDPAGAIESLRPTVKYDLAYPDAFQSLYPAYIRGIAYLQLGDGRSAAAEFQKVLDHPGIVGREVTGALSHLQFARAQKMMGDEAAARKSYEDFLNLWKNADPDLPIYQQAKAEYAKLPKR